MTAPGKGHVFPSECRPTHHEQTGAVVWQKHYEPFGGEEQKSGSIENTYQFTGKGYDEVTGLYYFNARWYDKDVGRFISEDPLWGNIFDPQSLNRFMYGRGNPYKYTDRTGKFVFCIAAAIGYTGYTAVAALADLTIAYSMSKALQAANAKLKKPNKLIVKTNYKKEKQKLAEGNKTEPPKGEDPRKNPTPDPRPTLEQRGAREPFWAKIIRAIHNVHGEQSPGAVLTSIPDKENEKDIEQWPDETSSEENDSENSGLEEEKNDQ